MAHDADVLTASGVPAGAERYGHNLPLIDGNKTYRQVTEEVFAPTERRPPLRWWLALAVTLSMLSLGAWAVVQTLTRGIGTWGLNRTVGWASFSPTWGMILVR